MSTASNSTPSTENRNGQYAKFDEYVDYQVSRTGSHIKANDLLTTAVGISTIFLGYLLLFILCDHWLIKGGFGHLSRLIMLVGVILASIGWAVWKLVLPYFKKVTRLYSARALEQTSEDMHGALLNLVDLQRSDRKVNPDIISSLEKRAALTLSQTDTEQAVDRRPLMRLSYCLLFVVAILCFYALFSPKQIWPSLSAAISFSSQREFATQTQISSVTPGNTEVLAGSQLEVIVDLRGEVPEDVTLFYTSSDQGRVDEPIKLRAMDETLKRFQGLIVGVNGRGIRQNLSYHIEAGDAVSEEYQVSVIQPPSATVHSVHYDYPSYMELAAVEQPGGAIDAYEGTKVTVDATTNMPITSFEVLFSDEEDSASLLEEFQVEKSIDKNTISASWKLKLRSDGTFPKFYQIKCRNEAGQVTLSPTVYPLMIRRDLPPEISLLSPKHDLKLPSNGTVPISVIAEDPDFKLRYLNLRVEKQQIRILDKTLFEGDRKSVGINYDLALEPLRLNPGDTIYFWVEARDNKHPSGNRKNTPKIKIEIQEPVSPEEAKKQLQEQKQKAAEEKQQQNPDQQKQPGQQKGQEKQPGQQPGDGDQPMPDQKEQGDSKSDSGKQPGDQKQPGNEDQKQSEQRGQKKSDSPESGAEPNPVPGKGQIQSKPEKKEGLDSDGSDDQAALKKILEKLKKEGQEPDSDQKQPENEKQGSEKQDSERPGSDKQMQEPESNGADSKSSESSSSQDKNSQGTPGQGQNQDKNQKPQPSSKANENNPDQKSADQKSPPQKGRVEDGKKEPSDSKEADRKMKTEGDPQGKARPDNDPDADPKRSNSDVKRDPNEKPAMRPGDKNSPNANPQEKPEQSSSKPGQQNDQPDQKPGSEMRKPQQSNDNPSSPKQQQAADGKKSQQKQDQPDGSNQPPGGKPEANDQKSKRPQDGENGNSSQNDQGQKGSQQPGKGDSTGQKGNQEQGNKGNPSGSSKSMEQNQSSEKQGQDQNQQNKGQSGNNQNKNQNQKGNQSGVQKGDQAGGQKGGQKGGQGSSEGKGQSQKSNSQAAGSSKGSNSSDPQGSSSTTGGTAPGDSESGGAGSSPALPDADEANLEYGKEAANLVLKRIKDELKREEVDPELLKELGWSKEEMKQFSERLQKQLQMQDNNQQSPESLARKRQFEEMLKSLKPAPRAARRNRNSTREQTSDSLGPRRLPVPEEYREAYEAFTRGLANQKPADK